MRRRLLAAAVLAVLATGPVDAAEPVVSLWYRGTPAGTPALDDLVAIRAAGFEAITWPAEHAAALTELGRLAERAGLAVVLQPDAARLQLAGRFDVRLATMGAHRLPAVVWRAVAGGARTISLDPGHRSGTGLGVSAGAREPAWRRPAVAIARQLSANAALFDVLEAAPAPRDVSARAPGVDVALLHSPRAWVVIATNDRDTRGRAEVELPRGVPYAIWASLVDDSTLGMVDRPAGARWMLELGPGQARVYVIDKVLR